ncbi:hypothetical protein H0H93_004143 [Arthromyces matolae]|nr:hypothetical protein H0H93_004143 [Arthromyces matolae]
MPGPGAKKKTKAHRSPVHSSPNKAASTTDAYVGDINQAVGWGPIADILCLIFQIPDLSTRSGLKKVHANFDAIYRKLDKACEKYSDNERIAGGVIVIYSQMCADSLLRNKLFEKGLLGKLLPLLDIESSRHMALRALSTITHHGGVEIRKEISRQTTSKLLQLVDEFSDDKNIGELVVTILSHSITGVLDGEQVTDPALLASMDIRSILKVTTDTSKKEWASPYLINHALGLLAASTLHASDICKAYPPALRYLVAGLRSTDWVIRCCSLGGVIRLHRNESEPDMRALDPNKFVACVQRGFPAHLEDRILDYGFQRCDTFLTVLTTRDYQKAMVDCARDHNMYSLGLKLAEYILRTEFAIADGVFSTQDPKTGLMQRAVEHAGDMGLQILQEFPTAGKAKWEEGIAFLMSAMEDAKVFVEEAPPDNRHMNAVLYWFILLTITIKGPDLSPDLKELEHAFKARKFADEFCRAIDLTPSRTNLRLAQETVVKYYTAAASEFDSVIAKLSRNDRPKTVSYEDVKDGLAEWLEDPHAHDEVDGELYGLHPRVNTNSVELYRCSFCGNPSAALRKCSGCSKTRYFKALSPVFVKPDHITKVLRRGMSEVSLGRP